MTISSNTARASFVCNGVSTVFPVPIQAYLAADFEVLLTNTTTAALGGIAAGSSIVLVLNSDYTLASSGTLAPPQWTLTTQNGQLTSPYPTGLILQAILNPADTQQTQYVQGQQFPSLAVQTNLDRLTQMVLRLQDQVNRSWRAPDGDTSVAGFLMPAAAARANLFASFSSNGQPVLVAPLGGNLGALNGFIQGNQAATPGVAMKIDNIIEQAGNPFPLVNEGAIWPSSAYSYAAFSQTMTAATVPGQGFSGPLSALFAFANNNGATAPVNGATIDAVARQSNGTVFGANIIARNAAATTLTKLVGLEVDIEPAVGTTMDPNSVGLVFNIFSIASPAPVSLAGAVGGGSWANGHLTSNIRGTHHGVNTGDTVTAQSFINTINGTFTSGAIVLGTGIAQGITYGGLGFGTSPFTYSDSSNNLTVQMGSTDAVVFRNHTGAVNHALTLSSLGLAQANAPPAGGSNLLGLTLTSTANLGLFVGSGVPTLSAAQGSLYMRTDGSSAATRLYVNTNGTTGWTNLVSAT